MADSSPSDDVFDVEKIRELIELMKEHELGELDLRQGDKRIQLVRTPGGSVPANIALPNTPVQPAAAVEPPAEDEHIAVVKSPMVGTFYAAPNPDSPAYVKVGDHVGPETTVCIVEAMKVFNQIPAEVSGKIVSVLVENGEPVEFGQAMFKVDTRE